MLADLVGVHRDLLAEAARLRGVCQRGELPEPFASLVLAHVEAMRFHVQREERFLWPAIRGMLADDPGAATGLRATIATMTAEHADLRRLDAHVRRHAPEDVELAAPVVTFLDRVEAHHSYEDEVLFPRVLAHLAHAARLRLPM